MAAPTRPSDATHVVDASAVLAMLLGEEGAELVRAAGPGGAVSAVNLSEIMSKLIDRGAPLSIVIDKLERLALHVVPFGRAEAEHAASLREMTRDHDISFADRACLALGLALRLPILTSDRAWKRLDLGLEIRVIR